MNCPFPDILYIHVPPKPFIALLQGLISHGMSKRLWVIHTEHLLSIPTRRESVSKGVACWTFSGDDSIDTMATIATIRMRVLEDCPRDCVWQALSLCLRLRLGVT